MKWHILRTLKTIGHNFNPILNHCSVNVASVTENFLSSHQSAVTQGGTFEDHAIYNALRACGRTSEGIPTLAPLKLHGRVARGVKLSNSVAPPGPLVYPHNKLQSQITESNSFGVSRGMSQFQLREKGFSDRRRALRRRGSR